MLHHSGPLWRFQETAPCLALEVVKVANRSTKLPLNLLTMKTTSAHPATTPSGSSSSSGGVGGGASPSMSTSAYSFTAATDTSSLMPPNTKASYSMELRSVSFTPSIPSSEVFFFGPKEDSTFCSLCAEDIEPPFTQRTHVAASSRASHTNHTCREVALDHLALLGIRGYPLDHMYAVWSDVLYHSPIFPRIPELTSPLWTWEERAAALLPHLKLLREMKVLDICLAGVAQQNDSVDIVHSRRRVAFERVEYLGDCAWGNHVANRLMVLYPNEQWLYSERVYNFNCMRDAVEMNITLELLFDSLHLTDLLPSRCVEHVGSGKIKADVVEAVLGELHCNVWGLQPEIVDDVPFVEVNGEREDALLALVQHCLTEMYDLLVLGYARELSWNAIPIAKNLAARNLWLETQPQLRFHKTGRRHWNRPRAGAVGAMGMSNAVFNSYSFNQSTAAAAGGAASPSAMSSSLAAVNATVWSPTSIVGSFLSAPLASTSVTASPSRSDATPPTDKGTDKSAEAAAQGGAPSNSPLPKQEERGEKSSFVEPPVSNITAATSAAAVTIGAAHKTVGAITSAGGTSLRGGLSTAAAGQRYVLPALPRLHDAPTPYPTHLPHPLLSEENQPPLSFHDRTAPAIFHARQRLTSFAYTGGDVFSAFHKSFLRLHLLKDDTRQVFHFVEPKAAMQKYLHDVAPAAAAAAGVSSPAGSLIHWLSAEETSVFFRDPFYHLPAHSHQPEQLTTTEEVVVEETTAVAPPSMNTDSNDTNHSTCTATTTDDNNNNNNSFPGGDNLNGAEGLATFAAGTTDASKTCEGGSATLSASPSTVSTTRRTTVLTRVWSGVQRGAAIATVCRPDTLRDHVHAVALAVKSAFPLLQAESDGVDNDADEHNDGDSQSTVIRGQWKRSRWVPPGIKPPTVGVINDQHPLHHGAFAYAGVGISRPFDVALGHLRRKQRHQAEAEAAAPQTEIHSDNAEGETSSTGTSTAGVVSAEKEALPESVNNFKEAPVNVATGEMENSTSAGDEIASVTIAEGASGVEGTLEGVHGQDESTLRSTVWDYWCQKGREKWMQDNSFFTQRFSMLAGKERTTTTTSGMGPSSDATPAKPSRLTPVNGAASIPVFRVKKNES